MRYAAIGGNHPLIVAEDGINMRLPVFPLPGTDLSTPEILVQGFYINIVGAVWLDMAVNQINKLVMIDWESLLSVSARDLNSLFLFGAYFRN
jgi:hypothetical protein